MPPEKHLIEYLQTNYNRFTASQKRIALYVIDNNQQAPFHTVDELARQCRVNPSTVVRFCGNAGTEDIRISKGASTEFTGPFESAG